MKLLKESKYKKSLIVVLAQVIIMIIAVVAIIVCGNKRHEVVSPDLSSWQSRYASFVDGRWVSNQSELPADVDYEQQEVDLIYGPYLALDAGTYSVSIDYSCEASQSFEVHSFADDSHIVTYENMLLDPRSDTNTVHFTLKKPVSDLEVRVHYDGDGGVEIKSINIVPSLYIVRMIVLAVGIIVLLLDLLLFVGDVIKYDPEEDVFVEKERNALVCPNNGLKWDTLEKIEFALCIFFCLLLFVITFYLTVKQVVNGRELNYDYPVHADAAIQITRFNIVEKFTEDPHILWHLLVNIIYRLMGAEEVAYAAGLVTAICVSTTYILTYNFATYFSKVGASVMSFIISMVGPLYMPWVNKHYYLGQGAPNTWHNPTNIAVKPFAVVVFLLVCLLLADSKDIKTRKTKIITAILLLVSVIAKPSFVMAFIPGLGVWMVIRSILGKRVCIKKYLVICSLFIPAVLMIAFDYVTYYGEETEAGIGIELFRVNRYYTLHPWVSSLLVIGFPLLFIILNIKREVHRIDTQIAVLYCTAGWIMSSFLYEKGPRETHGNMGWAYLLSLYILWMVTLSHFLPDVIGFDIGKRKEKYKQGLLLGALIFHFLFGIGYLLHLCVTNDIC